MFNTGSSTPELTPCPHSSCYLPPPHHQSVPGAVSSIPTTRGCSSGDLPVTGAPIPVAGPSCLLQKHTRTRWTSWVEKQCCNRPPSLPPSHPLQQSTLLRALCRGKDGGEGAARRVLREALQAPLDCRHWSRCRAPGRGEASTYLFTEGSVLQHP